MADSDPSSTSRRAVLLAAGSAGVAALASGCAGSTPKSGSPDRVAVVPVTSSAGTATAPTAVPACVLSPESGEGPYYVADAQVRSDIVEDRGGVPLHLDLTVVRTVRGCRPLAGIAVDVWQADALGKYSADGATFLRGTQRTDGSGKVSFRTIVPGWYAHIAPHVHVKVHPDARTEAATQLFLPEDLLRQVYRRDPYSRRKAPAHPNTRDDRFAAKGKLLTLGPIADGAGYRASFTIGLR
ncbi:intradiol ring-cleavage dioxygenase [Streptomyces sp. NPDC060010]|uniref:dioxygenase family protein n=1 Tax=Streptomyces sp. NPDC060010 TaxID=3347036 RepID=UPI0036CAF4DC